MSPLPENGAHGVSRTELQTADRTADGSTAGGHADRAPADPALLRGLIDQAPCPIYAKAPDGRYLFVNASFDRVANPDGRPIVGRRSDEIYGPELAAAYAAHDAEVLATGTAVTYEFAYERADRTVTYATVKFPVRAADGTLTAVGGIDIDITPRARREAILRESESRFREMADTIPALIWTCDSAGQCTFVNRRWVEYTGRTVAQELGKGFAETIHPEDRDRTIDREPELFATRAPGSVEYRLRRTDGEYRWFLDTWAPRYASDGTFLGFIGTLVDVTDRRELEQTLARTQRLEALGRLTGGVAHDFNNLLTVVLGSCEMLAEMIDPASPLQALAQRAASASRRGSELTRRLLAFSRHQTLEPKAVDIAALLDQLRQLLQRTLGEEIEIATPALCGLWPALVDGAELEHALLNLAINARDAMPRGGSLVMTAANVTLDAGALAAAHLQCRPGDYIALSVVDNGTGMTPETLRRAVEPFFTTKEVGKGSGLGLSMVYGFCKQSGGDMRIDSAPGRGTTVTLFLPRAQAEDTAEVPSLDAAETAAVGGSETILVVEDNDDVRAYVVGCLSVLGYRVLSATDGRASLELLDDHPEIDLLFADVVMPGGMSGWELAAAARSRRPALRVLVTTGYAPGHASRPPGTEWLPVLVKPYRRQLLAQKVREVLDADPPPGRAAA
ncbi:MAG: PAS domain-containing protein [Rhodospirillaceae bacterium]|nr:PAS domain-containing protein [Rhodospirillaceae bacterium]